MIEPVLTMIPGPTPVHPSILAELSRPTVSHLAPSFVVAFRECLERLRRIAYAPTAQPFVVAGAGTLAMEMALVNLVAQGERLLVVSQGYFGDRWADLARAFGIEVELLQAEWGHVISPEELARRVGEHGPVAVACTHVDTSTGAAAPIAAYARALRDAGALFVVDGVCATAGMEEKMDDWGIDVLLTGAQKAFGTPPGLAILLAGPRAMERRRARASVPAYYADLLRWEPIMNDPGRYFSTPAVNEICALNVAAGLVLEEGLEPRFERHRRIARAVRAGLARVGFASFTDAACLADTLSVPRYPEGLEDAPFRAALAQRGVVVAGGLGPIAGRTFRIGHMGNIGSGEIYRLLQAVEDALVALGRDVERGSAVGAAARALNG